MGSTADRRIDVEYWREQFPVTRRGVYLYSGGFNPCCRPVEEAISRAITLWRNGGVALWEESQDTLRQFRERLGRLMNVDAEDIVVLDNTTTGINLAIDLLRMGSGDNVIVTDLEFMTNTYAFLGRNQSIEIRVARNRDGRIPLQAIEALIDRHTRAIHISHVTVSNGFRHDLVRVGELADAHGVPLIVDLAQSLGVIPVDLAASRVTFAAGTMSKWMLGPAGVGFLVVNKAFQREPPPSPGWFAAERNWELFAPAFFDTAQRFQGGMLNLLGLHGANAAAAIVEEIGIDAIHGRVQQLVDRVVGFLGEREIRTETPHSPGERAGIVFVTGVNHDLLSSEARERKVTVGHFLNGIRVDVHFFNNDDDLDTITEMIEKHRW